MSHILRLSFWKIAEFSKIIRKENTIHLIEFNKKIFGTLKKMNNQWREIENYDQIFDLIWTLLALNIDVIKINQK